MGRFSAENLPMSIIITTFALDFMKRQNRLRVVQASFATVSNWYPGSTFFSLMFKVDAAGIMFVSRSEYWSRAFVVPIQYGPDAKNRQL